jgi:hypothetical protein
VQIVALTLEKRMFFHVQYDIKVPGRSAMSSSLTQPRKTDARSVFNAGGHFGIHRSLTQNPPFALALGARIGDHAAQALTRRTSAGHAEESLLVAYLAAPSTRSASNRSFARRRSAASAVLATLVAANRNVGFRSEYCLFELQRDIFPQIRTALGPAAPAGTAAKKISEAEKVSEDLADILKDCRVESARPRAAHGSMSKAVVRRPLVRIRQDSVGLAAFFEFFFRVRIIRIAIRMKLQRQLAIGALDLLLVGFAGNPENFVIVAF